MAKRKNRYYKRKPNTIGRHSANDRKNKINIKIYGVMRDLLTDYKTFLEELETKNQIKQFANKIQNRSAQWNVIRLPRITATHIKRILSCKKGVSTLCKQLYQYVSSNFFTRGDVVEEKVVKILTDSGFEIAHCNQIWIHDTLSWFSCTTDGVVIENGIIKTVIEIKSYTSEKRFKSAISYNDGVYSIKENSNEYSQIQMIAEIVNVSFVLLIVEYRLELIRIPVKRDLDFLFYRFEKIKTFYFRYYVPFCIYGAKEIKKTKSSKKLHHMSAITYNRLMRLLSKNEDSIISDSETNLLSYYGPEKPSATKDGYFEMFFDKILFNKLVNEALTSNKIMIEENELKEKLENARDKKA
jgi:hypothetical protein